jgi:anti-anti-sigma factor
MGAPDPTADRTAPRAAIRTVDDNAGRRTVIINGEVDLASAPAVELLLQLHLDDGGADHLDLDLAEVSFFSAAGLRSVLAAEHAAATAGVGFRITAMSPVVRHVLRATGVAEEAVRAGR